MYFMMLSESRMLNSDLRSRRKCGNESDSQHGNNGCLQPSPVRRQSLLKRQRSYSCGDLSPSDTEWDVEDEDEQSSTKTSALSRPFNSLATASRGETNKDKKDKVDFSLPHSGSNPEGKSGRRQNWMSQKQQSKSFDFSWNSGMWSPVDERNKVMIIVPTPKLSACRSRLKLPAMFQMDSGSSYESYEAAEDQGQSLELMLPTLNEPKLNVSKTEYQRENQPRDLKTSPNIESRVSPGLEGRSPQGHEGRVVQGLEGRTTPGLEVTPSESPKHRRVRPDSKTLLRIFREGKSHSMDSFDEICYDENLDKESDIMGSNLSKTPDPISNRRQRLLQKRKSRSLDVYEPIEESFPAGIQVNSYGRSQMRQRSGFQAAPSMDIEQFRSRSPRLVGTKFRPDLNKQSKINIYDDKILNPRDFPIDPRDVGEVETATKPTLSGRIQKPQHPKISSGLGELRQVIDRGEEEMDDKGHPDSECTYRRRQFTQTKSFSCEVTSATPKPVLDPRRKQSEPIVGASRSRAKGRQLPRAPTEGAGNDIYRQQFDCRIAQIPEKLQSLSRSRDLVISQSPRTRDRLIYPGSNPTSTNKKSYVTGAAEGKRKNFSEQKSFSYEFREYQQRYTTSRRTGSTGTIPTITSSRMRDYLSDREMKDMEFAQCNQNFRSDIQNKYQSRHRRSGGDTKEGKPEQRNTPEKRKGFSEQKSFSYEIATSCTRHSSMERSSRLGEERGQRAISSSPHPPYRLVASNCELGGDLKYYDTPAVDKRSRVSSGRDSIAQLGQDYLRHIKKQQLYATCPREMVQAYQENDKSVPIRDRPQITILAEQVDSEFYRSVENRCQIREVSRRNNSPSSKLIVKNKEENNKNFLHPNSAKLQRKPRPVRKDKEELKKYNIEPNKIIALDDKIHQHEASRKIESHSIRPSSKFQNDEIQSQQNSSKIDRKERGLLCDVEQKGTKNQQSGTFEASTSSKNSKIEEKRTKSPLRYQFSEDIQLGQQRKLYYKIQDAKFILPFTFESVDREEGQLVSDGVVQWRRKLQEAGNVIARTAAEWQVWRRSAGMASTLDGKPSERQERDVSKHSESNKDKRQQFAHQKSFSYDIVTANQIVSGIYEGEGSSQISPSPTKTSTNMSQCVREKRMARLKSKKSYSLDEYVQVVPEAPISIQPGACSSGQHRNSPVYRLSDVNEAITYRAQQLQQQQQQQQQQQSISVDRCPSRPKPAQQHQFQHYSTDPHSESVKVELKSSDKTSKYFQGVANPQILNCRSEAYYSNSRDLMSKEKIMEELSQAQTINAKLFKLHKMKAIQPEADHCGVEQGQVNCSKVDIESENQPKNSGKGGSKLPVSRILKKFKLERSQPSIKK